MSAIFGDLKGTLKFDQVVDGVATKLHSARDFLHNRRNEIFELSPFKNIRQKVSDFIPSGSGHLNDYIGPGTWTKYFPAAKGSRQSPIDLSSSHVQYDETLGDGKFSLNYCPADCVEIRNTGASWQIVAKENAQSTITAVHLPGTYRLRQIHCHWGSEPCNGSEHCCDGVGYAAELHLVHYNSKYGTFEEAIKHPDGLAVLGTFLQEADHDNPDLEILIRLINNIPYKTSVTSLPEGFDPSILLPPSLEYWTYEGSLTTPPCNECVLWTVFRTPLSISRRQLDILRQMYAVSVEDSERNPQRLVNNVRPAQPLNNRRIRASFRI